MKICSPPQPVILTLTPALTNPTLYIAPPGEPDGPAFASLLLSASHPALDAPPWKWFFLAPDEDVFSPEDARRWGGPYAANPTPTPPTRLQHIPVGGRQISPPAMPAGGAPNPGSTGGGSPNPSPGTTSSVMYIPAHNTAAFALQAAEARLAPGHQTDGERAMAIETGRRRVGSLGVGVGGSYEA